MVSKSFVVEIENLNEHNWKFGHNVHLRRKMREKWLLFHFESSWVVMYVELDKPNNCRQRSFLRTSSSLGKMKSLLIFFLKETLGEVLHSMMHTQIYYTEFLPNVFSHIHAFWQCRAFSKCIILSLWTQEIEFSIGRSRWKYIFMLYLQKSVILGTSCIFWSVEEKSKVVIWDEIEKYFFQQLLQNIFFCCFKMT